MRRLLALVSGIVLVDTMLYAALVPLLPRYAEDYELSKTGAGLLVASYAAGTLAAAIPAGVAAARVGPRPTVVCGLGLISAASVGFAFAGDVWSLGISRLVQGIGSSLSWTGGLAWLVVLTPRARRGEVLGAAIGAAVFGALLGPVLGAAAGLAGARPAFVFVGVLVALLLAWSLRTRGAPAEPTSLESVVRAAREHRMLAGLWLIILPSLLFGVLAVLVPLELGAAGWGVVAIGAVFLGSAACEAVLHPLVGRFSDRRGRSLPLQLALVASVAVSLGLAWAGRPAAIVPLVIGSAFAFGAFFTPATALVSDSAERLGLAQGLAFALTSAAWAAGNAFGPAAGGALAEAAGDTVPYLIISGLCLVTLALVAWPRLRPARSFTFARRTE